MTKARDLANIIAGGFTSGDIPNLSTDKLTSGTLPDARIAAVSASKLTGALPAIDGSSLTNVSEVKPTVSSATPSTITNSATDVVLAGTNFTATPNVEFIASTGVITTPNTIVRNSNVQLTVNVTLPTDGTYFVRVENPNGLAVRTSSAIITVSDAPTWNTSAGSLGSFAGDFSGTLSTLSASGDSTIAYSETTSALSGAGITLNSSTGALTTSDFGGSSTTPTTYNFTIRATDGESQTADRSFSISSTFGATGGATFN